MAGVVDEYEAQQRWRDWDRFLDRLPLTPGQRVWDVGCGVGEVSRRLAQRGATVLALDGDDTMLAATRARCEGLDVTTESLNLLEAAPSSDDPVDGIWCGFSLAYFVEPAAALRRWTHGGRRLTDGGWIAALEIDRLFTAHAPLDRDVAALLDAFEIGMRKEGHYDFRMGSRLPHELAALGLDIVHLEQPGDPELSFDGPAPDEILAAWSRRFDRMRGIQERLGDRFGEVREGFLSTLADPAHTSPSALWFVLARKRGTTDG